MAGTMTISEAAETLKVHRNKVKRLVEEGYEDQEGKHVALRSWKNPLDRREVLIDADDVNKLKRISRGSMESAKDS
jgi:hypothetical protein